MISQMHYVTKNLNENIWKLEENKGYFFENIIYDILKKELKPYFRLGLRIVKTSSTRDDGMDIIINSSVSFTLFGMNFSASSDNPVEIVIECKSTDLGNIVLDKFAKNLIVNARRSIKYFILITNGTISSYSYYEALTTFAQSNCEFILIDNYFLNSYLRNNNYSIVKMPQLPSGNIPLEISYQIQKGRLEGKDCFDLYLCIKNYSSSILGIELDLITNRNWMMQSQPNILTIAPYRGKTVKLIAKKIFFDGIDDFKLKISYENTDQILHIKNPDIITDFQPPLTGSEHKKIIASTSQHLIALNHFQSFFITGEAGIGKTRIIDEILKTIVDTDFSIVSILCNNNLTNLVNAFNKGLKQPSLNSITDIINYLREDEFTRYIFIIEDLHNATKEVLLSLKKMILLMPSDIAASIILAGRNDDTFYNEQFFSFFNWYESEKNEYMNPIFIAPLEDAECRDFVITMVNDIPPIVLEKILKLSQNNPFYIVQFIEYLLEINLVKLINRNTVGINNVSTFTKQAYIPNSIDMLLRKRLQNLLRLPMGEKLFDLLHIISIVGIRAPQKVASCFLGIECLEKIESLINNRFLKFSDDGDIQIIHETLYLYLKKNLEKKTTIKKYSKIICENYPDLILLLNDFQKGAVYYYANHFESASKYFKPIIDSIENAQNISSNNLSVDCFEYLNIVYDLLKKNKSAGSEKVLIASVYIAMHNKDYGTTSLALKHAIHNVENYHSSDKQLLNTFLQLRAHTELTAAHLSKSKQYFMELLAEERLHPDYFTEESKFDLYDRSASLFTRYNHKALATKYNELSLQVADSLDDPKLHSLAIMMKAKINFYSDTHRAIDYMNEAKKMMIGNMAYRINCHNNSAIIGASLLISDRTKSERTQFIKETELILDEALNNNYSFVIIRCNLLLAVLHYLNAENQVEINVSKYYIEHGINASVQYGCEKLMNYFYNLKGVISIFEEESPTLTLSYFDTMIQFLQKQDLLFLGDLEFCYGNIVSITNYAKYVLNHCDENFLYRFLNKLSYYDSNSNCDFHCDSRNNCYYSCVKNVKIFKKNINKLDDGQLILVDKKNAYPIVDPKTGYYLIIH